jgi:Peptidase A4 family
MTVTTFPPPPKDFDPATASAQALARHGLPRRPDAKNEPGLRKLWDRALARKPTFLQARLVEERVWRSHPHRAPAGGDFGPLGGHWGGAVVQVASLNLNPPEPANVVFAEWKVPTISTTPAESGTQIVGFWVGLGGYGTNSLLQAGTAATLTGSTVSYWAWTEWFPANYKVDNLAVSPGDVVSVLVCAPQPTQGFVSMMNQNTNQAISVGISDPLGTTPYDGSTVEWIIEATGSQMPNFGTVAFTQVTAGTQHHVIDLTHAFTVNTVLNGKTLATGKVLSSQNEVEVIWDAAS